MKGFSTRNLKYMQFFAEFRPDFHIVSLLTKISDPPLCGACCQNFPLAIVP